MADETTTIEETSTALMPVERGEEIPRPVTLEEMVLVDRERGLAFNAAIAAVTYDLRVKSIALTNPEDWVLFLRPDGRATAYLQDSGCKRIKPLWGISIYPSEKADKFQIERIPANAPPGDPFAYVFTGDGFCARTGDTVIGIEGVRRSDEDFVKGKTGIHLEVEVRKAARSNMEGGIVRYLTGLQNLAASELGTVWAKQGTGRLIDHCAKGKGYGSQAQRHGEIAEGDYGDPPFCPACEKTGKKVRMRLRQGPRGPFWGCPNYKDCEQKPINAKKVEIPDHERGLNEPGPAEQVRGKGTPVPSSSLGALKNATLQVIQSDKFPAKHRADMRRLILAATDENMLMDAQTQINDLMPKAAGREPGE